MRPPLAHLDLPFFEPHHRALGATLADWAAAQSVDASDDRRACRDWVVRLGQAGWLRYCVPASEGGALPELDSRALVIARETLAFFSSLADFAFAMQGLGSGAITLAGSNTQRARYLPEVAAGRKIAAFALSEPEAGSDVAAIATRAVRDGEYWRLDGEKMWISNGGIADFYVVFARTDPAGGARGLSAFVVDAGTEGLDDSQAIHVIAPHPLARLRFDGCRIASDALLGQENGGFKLAMATLDIFRASVAGAALGLARRALAEAVSWVRSRRMFGQRLADFQLTQARLGQCAAELDAAALLTYRAAWLRDEAIARGQPRRVTAEAAMAKLQATETAQQVIDTAVQLHGGRGVEVGSRVEALYRDIRALRIYEGASEVQQLIIGRSILGAE
ncbi:MAG: acyl-CoA dehydrogenase family protein [Casimicrobiaceae bacterium]